MSSAAMDAPATVGARIDMNLAPAALEMHSPQLLSHEVGVAQLGGGVVAEGGTMTVTCVARGAKPAAYIYWNSEPPLDLTNTVEEVSLIYFSFNTFFLNVKKSPHFST